MIYKFFRDDSIGDTHIWNLFRYPSTFGKPRESGPSEHHLDLFVSTGYKGRSSWLWRSWSKFWICGFIVTTFVYCLHCCYLVFRFLMFNSLIKYENWNSNYKNFTAFEERIETDWFQWFMKLPLISHRFELILSINLYELLIMTPPLLKHWRKIDSW